MGNTSTIAATKVAAVLKIKVHQMFRDCLIKLSKSVIFVATVLTMLSTQYLLKASPAKIFVQRSFPVQLPLTAMESEGTKCTTISSAFFDFGETTYLESDHITHTFILRNDNSTPITIVRLQPSCDCISVHIGTTAKRLPFLVQPGQSVRVHFSVNLEHIRPGVLNKVVTVVAKDQSSPVATLRIIGTLKPTASTSPHDVDFGETTYGTVETAVVNVLWNSRLEVNGHVPLLVSSDPSIEVVEEPNTISEGSRHTSRESTVSKTYLLTLSSRANLGPIMAKISIASSIPSLANVFISVKGRIVGDFYSATQLIGFGTINPGTTASRIVILNASPGFGLEDLESLNFISGSPYLSEEVKNSSDQIHEVSAKPFATKATNTKSQPARLTLRVTISSAAPPGAFRSQITVLAANGQRLILPVFAFINH